MKQIYNSEKNGQIIVKGFFGRYAIKAGGCYQSGAYVNNLWHKVLKRIPKEDKIKNILLLGLGGGGVIKEIRKGFGQIKIIAVEYDPVMVEIARRTYLKKEEVRIILKDAVEAVGDLQQKFDLILIDLFKGKTPAEILVSKGFIKNVQELLSKNGYLLVNFYLDEKILAPIFNCYFSQERGLRYWANKMAIYRHFGQGQIGDPLPQGFLFKEQSLEYLKTITYKSEQKQFIIDNRGTTIRRQVGLICFENYFGDEEPMIDKTKGFKIVSWQPLTRINKPKGWHRNYFVTKHYQNGIVCLDDKQRYFENWTAHAQRHRKKWLKDKNYKIEEIDYQTFKDAYQNAKPIGWFLRLGFLKILEHHFKLYPDKISIFAGREVGSKKIIGALATVDYDDISQSIHLISFIDPKSRKRSIGVGLIDYWYQHCLRRGIKFLNFGIIWQKGYPRSWRGFSQFKKQFDLYLLNYPQNLIRIFYRKKAEVRI